jgi:hypothetical protein
MDTTNSHESLPLYLHLARASQQRNRPWVRDKLLVLAGATAAEKGLDLIAAFCRREVLANNPRHLIGHHPTVAAALEDERFQGYLAQLRRRYTRERAEHMLDSLGIDMAHEREAYFSLYEYAASLLGTSPTELDRLFGDVDDLTTEARQPLSRAQGPAEGELPQPHLESPATQGAWIALCFAAVSLVALAIVWWLWA